MNVTVCLTQSTTATFTCIVNRGTSQITTVSWQILTGGEFISVSGRPRHMSNSALNGNTITDTLIVTDVSVNDNSAQYRCEPTDTVISNIATLTVIGTYVCIYVCIICMYIHNYIYATLCMGRLKGKMVLQMS